MSRYHERKAAGICIDCNLPALEGSLCCEVHTQKRKEMNRRHHEERVALKKANHDLCKIPACRENAFMHRYCKKHLRARAAQHIRYRERLKEAGRCARCGVELIDFEGGGITNVTCMNCSERINQRYWK